MARFVVREVLCKSLINRIEGMPFRWSINPYRGCRHACVYCYARPTHEYLGLNGADDFQEVVFAKVNAPQMVRAELARRSWRGESVAIGTATDPYQQAESRFRLTRGILEAFRDFRNPLTITTKSPMVLRDADLLSDLARHAAVTVQMTVTTLNEELWRALEPTTSKPWKRLRALASLHEQGVQTAVFLSPILPGLTDGPAELEAIVAAAAEARVEYLWGGALRLGPGVREYYLDFLQREHPELLRRYRRLYPRTYAPADYQEQVRHRIDALRARYGLLRERPSHEPDSPARPLQLSLLTALS